jgi:hypothetical protein
MFLTHEKVMEVDDHRRMMYKWKEGTETEIN